MLMTTCRLRCVVCALMMTTIDDVDYLRMIHIYPDVGALEQAVPPQRLFQAAVQDGKSKKDMSALLFERKTSGA